MNGWAIYLLVYYVISFFVSLWYALEEKEIEVNWGTPVLTAFNLFALWMAVHP